MALDERSRHELFLRLEEVLGPEPASTLMEMMPPAGWADVATKRDLDIGLGGLEERFNLRFEAMEQKIEATKYELLAVFRGELVTAVTTQTRTLVLANLGAVLTTAVLAVGAARLV